MAHRGRGQDSVAWAWAAGWALASLGFVVSDAYSSPNRGLAPAYVLGFLGWTIGATGTIRFVRQQCQATAFGTAVAVAGWVVGAYVGVVVGLVWLETWNAGFWGPIMSASIGGAIGGGLTTPMLPVSGTWRRGLVGASSWGASFLLFHVLAFYVGYILMQLTVDPLAPVVGHIAATIPGWAVPAGLGGWAAARLASRSLRSSA